MTEQTSPPDQQAERQRVMRVLALTGTDDLEKAYAGFSGLPDWQFARRPETGLVMVRGRTGGGGAPFNLGEMSVTRSAVTLKTGETGHAYVAGRNHRKAAIAAVLDAAWQNPTLKQRIETEIVSPLSMTLQQNQDVARRRAAATKVDFFTMVRGED